MIFFIVSTMAVIYIWGEAIQGFAVSVFAIGFAMVYSVKELFMCLTGSIIRFRGHMYDIGDRIDVAGVRGDVIDIGILSTTLLEIGRGAANHKLTGKRIVFPNSSLLEKSVVNESFLGNYYMINIRIPLKIDEDWKKAQRILLQIAQETCAPYMEQARHQIRRMEKMKSLELPSVEPMVSLQIPSPDAIDLHLRIASPAHMKGRLEQLIITRFLEEFKSVSPALQGSPEPHSIV